jgi:2-polyprenyl-3-methyl-5-hydroxy-6-metoxy-1,4-benzoquinol methylase
MLRPNRACWCERSQLESFSPHYLVCLSCGTLVSQARIAPTQPATSGDDGGFYGQEYWLSHQRDRLGLPDIDQRARLDLPERCLYWIRALLAHTLPPSRTLDLGCSHGAFVSLLRFAGFDAMGLELSRWVVDYARRAFHIPVLEGPIERQQLPPQSLDAITLNDVLEHLPDPLSTMRQCVALLKPAGVLLIQTPCYPHPKTYEQLRQENHVFLKMLLEDEHLYLFSQSALRQLLASLGWPTVEFKPALFPYDLYAVVSRQPQATTPRDHVIMALSATPEARMVLALLDLNDRHAELQADRDLRIKALIELSADNDARLQVILKQQATIRQQQATIRTLEHNPLVRLLRSSKLVRLLRSSKLWRDQP